VDKQNLSFTLKSTYENAIIAIASLDIQCSFDTFHNRMYIEKLPINESAGEISDNTIEALRFYILQRFKFDPLTKHVHDACVTLAQFNSYDPVCDYLNAVQPTWDGAERIDALFIRYFGVKDTPYSRAAGRLLMVGAVRRARQPGCKFDEIAVLESEEGFNKSTFIATLFGRENFSDQTILGARDKEVQELVEGVWGYEISELSGMKRADVEYVSRQSDRARPAYGRRLVSRERTCVCIGTTNRTDGGYLKSETGNRRFWPLLATKRADISALLTERDQLWAEAATIEAQTIGGIRMDERLWAAAKVEQDERLTDDPWLEILAAIEPFRVGSEDRISYLMIFEILDIPARDQTAGILDRITACMRRLGWDKTNKTIRVGGRACKGFTRRVTV
jgi:predicted P-loop ATPase